MTIYMFCFLFFYFMSYKFFKQFSNLSNLFIFFAIKLCLYILTILLMLAMSVMMSHFFFFCHLSYFVFFSFSLSSSGIYQCYSSLQRCIFVSWHFQLCNCFVFHRFIFTSSFFSILRFSSFSFFFYWGIVVLQCCVSFYYTAKWSRVPCAI